MLRSMAFERSPSISFNVSLLGRGVDAPMPVILLGALGGMAAGGILGLFLGAALLALGYQIFMGWVAANPEAKPSPGEGSQRTAD